MGDQRSTSPEAGDSMTISNDRIEFACPFCSLGVIAGYSTEGDGFVLHAMPTCATYDGLSADRFLEACRRRRES